MYQYSEAFVKSKCICKSIHTWGKMGGGHISLVLSPIWSDMELVVYVSDGVCWRKTTNNYICIVRKNK